jgi:hypothetical protein
MRAWIALVLIVGCSSSSPKREEPLGSAGQTPPPVDASAAAGGGSGSAKAPVQAKRPPAPQPMPKDDRPIDHAKFRGFVNANDPKNGWIHASADGGCHVYINDGKPRPPGSFPAGTPIECPPAMLAPEFGYCTGSGMIHDNDKHDECICSPGDGDPPPPAFRMPCPKRP